jgi:hypothetical protein
MSDKNSKRKFSFSFRKKKDQSLISAARPTNLPQISNEGLSHAGKHLLLLIQHDVDGTNIKISQRDSVSWNALLSHNPSLEEKKKWIKELCSIHHFSPKELDDIANRVSQFITEHQPHMVMISI